MGIAAIAATLFVSSSSYAYNVKQTQSGVGVHWNQSNVVFQIDPSLADLPGAEERFGQAINKWSEVSGVPELRSLGSANIPQREPGADGVNTVFYKKTAYEPAGRALAITILTYDGNTGEIVDADIVVNGKYKFAVLPETSTTLHTTNTDGIVHSDEEASPDKIYDIHHVLAHETGHSLGLNDEEADGTVLMYRYSAPNDTSIREPQEDDRSGAASIYAGVSGSSADVATGCGGATVSPKNPSNASGRMALMFTVGLVAWMTLRSRRDAASMKTAAFVGIAALSLVSLPSLSNSGKTAHASLGHARATVTQSTTTLKNGVFHTEAVVSTDQCRAVNCPKTARVATWGGSMRGLRQEVGEQHAPRVGDEVDVSFQKLAVAASPFDAPFSRTSSASTGVVRVLTQAR